MSIATHMKGRPTWLRMTRCIAAKSARYSGHARQNGTGVSAVKKIYAVRYAIFIEAAQKKTKRQKRITLRSNLS